MKSQTPPWETSALTTSQHHRPHVYDLYTRKKTTTNTEEREDNSDTTSDMNSRKKRAVISVMLL